MDPPPPPAAGPSTGFQSASAILRSTHVPSLNSNRNASGNIPPPPKKAPPPASAEGGPLTNGGETSGSTAPVATTKPVNRPAASKNAIVYSVLQVSDLDELCDPTMKLVANALQRRNPVLPLIRNVGLEIGDIVVDYQVGTHNGVLFLR